MGDFTAEDFLAFCKSKPSEEAYDYVDDQRCALAQFLRSIGREDVSVGSHGFSDHTTGRDDQPIPDTIYRALRSLDNTFGELALRMEGELSREKAEPTP